MRSILPFDDLNNFVLRLKERFPDGKLCASKEEEDEIIDDIFDLLLLAYVTGYTITNLSLSSSWQPKLEDILETLDREVDGLTWTQRIEGYFANGGSVDDLAKVIWTEAHRDANESALNAAKHGGATTKTWITMLDDRVRDLHYPLEGQTIPIDADFYTFDGDKGQAPGLFGKAENNVNCRCALMFA